MSMRRAFVSASVVLMAALLALGTMGCEPKSSGDGTLPPPPDLDLPVPQTGVPEVPPAAAEPTVEIEEPESVVTEPTMETDEAEEMAAPAEAESAVETDEAEEMAAPAEAESTASPS